MLDVTPPALTVPAPHIIRPLEGGLWGSLDADLMRAGVTRPVRQAIITELKRVVGADRPRDHLADLSAWLKTRAAPVKAASLAMKLLRATAGGRLSTISYRTTVGNATDNVGNYSFSSVDIGTAAANRYVIVAMLGMYLSGTPTFTSITIDGNAMTTAGSTTAIPDIGTLGAIACLAWPSNTTATIVCNWSAGFQFDCVISVWAAYALPSATANAYVSDTSSPFSQSIAVPKGGIGVAVANSQNGSASSSWSGFTKRADTLVDGTALFAAADYTDGGSGSTPTVAATLSGGSQWGMIAASW